MNEMVKITVKYLKNKWRQNLKIVDPAPCVQWISGGSLVSVAHMNRLM